MFVLPNLAKILVFSFLITSMLSIGLRSGIAELRALIGARGFLVRALVANFVLVPLLGFALARMVPLPPETAEALILLACVPGGLSAIHFISHVKGRETMAEALFALMSLAAVVVSPWVLRVALPASAEMNFPHGRTLAFVLIAILAPLCAGLVLHDRSPDLAPKLSKILSWVSLVLFIAFEIVTKNLRHEAIHRLGWPAVGVMVLFIVASMAIGWLLGGPDRRSRQVLAAVTSMRNTAVCLIVVRYSALGDAALTPLIAFSLLMVTPNTLFSIGNAIWNKRAAAHSAALPKATAT